jgi:hypothetical protein
MTKTRLMQSMIAAPALALVVACGRDDQPRMDDALRNDLSLASQAQAYQPQQYVSPMEQQAMYGAVQPVAAGYAPGPYYAPAPAPAAPRRAAPAPRPVYRSSGVSRGTSSGTVYREPARASTPMKRNKARDATIGAVAGAAIGVATSAKKDRVKGGLIGAVAGGTIGAIIGNNVDVRRPNP